MKYLLYVIIVIASIMAAISAKAESPTVLIDRIRNGDGAIDLFKDVIGSELRQHLLKYNP